MPLKDILKIDYGYGYGYGSGHGYGSVSDMAAAGATNVEK